MAKVLTDEQNYHDIADAIRGKLDVETLYLPSEMADAIDGIQTGTSVTSEDEGKVVVEDDGSYILAEQTSISVSQNGTYDTTTNNEVTVNVEIPVDTYSITCSVSGGYNGGAVISVSVEGTEIFAATASDTYNLNYDKTEGTYIVDVYELNISVTPPTSSTGSLYIEVYQDERRDKGVLFGPVKPSGNNTSYGYSYTDTKFISVFYKDEDDSFALVNYIEGNGTQFINTGYSVKDTSRFELVAEIGASQQTYSTAFGTRATNDDSPSSQSCLFAPYWSGSNGNVNWGSYINAVTPFDKGHKTKYVVQKGSFNVTIQNVGLVANLFTSAASATNASLFLFTLGVNGADCGASYHCSMKLYRFRVYEGDNLVMELVPAEHDNQACLYDNVAEAYLYNAGTGSFVYGTDS